MSAPATVLPTGRVCILTETFHPIRGGGETQARALASGLVELGWSVLVMTRRSQRDLPADESIDGARVRRIPPTGRSRVGKWGLLVTAAWGLMRHRRSYDVVFVSGFRILGVPAVLVSRLLGKRCVLKADSLGEMSGSYFAPGLAKVGMRPDGLPFSLFLALRNRLLRRADGFVSVSSPIHGELHASGIDERRIHDVPNSVDVQWFQPLESGSRDAERAALGFEADTRVCTYTGRLVSYKGLPLLLDAWRDVASAEPGARLVLVGEGGLDMHACEDDLRRFAGEHGLEDSVLFVGPVADVRPWLRASDLFVFPSENEAFGISVIEAMAVGLPVISTDAGGLADIVTDGRDGIRVAVGDRDALVAALLGLVRDTARRRSLGQAARATVVETYAQDSVVRRIAALLGPVEASARAPGRAEAT